MRSASDKNVNTLCNSSVHKRTLPLGILVESWEAPLVAYIDYLPKQSSFRGMAGVDQRPSCLLI